MTTQYPEDEALKRSEEEDDLTSVNAENNQNYDPTENIKNSIESDSASPVILCQTKEKNPNYFSVIFANQKFYDTFGINDINTIGKNYDFLFDDLDLDHLSKDKLEYIHLIKMVKEFTTCSVVIKISNLDFTTYKTKFRILFTPLEITNETDCRYATFSFEQLVTNEPESEYQQDNGGDVQLLKNLERSLRHERLLREIESMILLDLKIPEIAKKIAKIFSEELKIDRCLIHDYHDSKTSFVVEHCNDSVKKMLEEDNENHDLSHVIQYINFQNHFFEHFGNKNEKSSIIVIDDALADPNLISIKPIHEEFKIESQIVATTVFNGKVNGGIYIHQSSKRMWSEEEVELVEMIADQFSIALDRSESINRVMIANHSLMETTLQLKESLKKEKEMRKMQNDFVALVSHEFKTPLQIIDSTREVMVRKLKSYNISDESLDKAFERIKSGIQRMNNLITSTLNLARMENSSGTVKLEKEIFDLKDFVLNIIKRNTPLLINKNITLITKLNNIPTSFYADPKLLDHSVTNALSNAIKYSPNNSTIKILGKANDKKVGIRVIDQGMGIPKSDVAKIGQKFFRASNALSTSGTGIGIYLAKHFVELHGGEIVIESEVGVGTTFTIVLPITPPNSPSPNKAPPLVA